MGCVEKEVWRTEPLETHLLYLLHVAVDGDVTDGVDGGVDRWLGEGVIFEGVPCCM